MQYLWEEEDVKCGMFVYLPPRNNKGKKFDPEHCSTRLYKIGFVGGRSKGTVLISMSDGMVGRVHTPNEMAHALTSSEMTPMPHKWLIKALDYMRDWYVNN